MLPTLCLVAGYDYKGQAPCSADFVQLALNRATSILAESDSFSRILLFDVRSGCIEEILAKGCDTIECLRLETHEAVGSSHYELQPSGVPRFVARGTRSLSILDVYRHLARVGREAPGSVVELAFVSHGWIGGPVLVNSFDRRPEAPERDPDDKDGRRYKDFAFQNMVPEQLAFIRAAFEPVSGHIVNFGCANAASARDILDQSAEQWRLEYADDHSYQFTILEEARSEYGKVDPVFFSDSHEFCRTLSEIRAFFLRRVCASYSQQIASAFGVPCFGAFPGTYSTFEQEGPFPVLVVPHGETFRSEFGKDFSTQLRFITDALGFSLDPGGRGLVRFDSAGVA